MGILRLDGYTTTPAQNIIDAIRARKAADAAKKAGKIPVGVGSRVEKLPVPTSWTKDYVAARFNHHRDSAENNDVMGRSWRTAMNSMTEGFSVCTLGSVIGKHHRRNFVNVVYYPNFKHVFNEERSRIMIPGHLLEGDKEKVWGSVAYVEYPGSDIHIFMRNEIEELLDGIHAKEVWKYRRSRDVFTKEPNPRKKRQYSYWLLDAKDLTHKVLVGGNEYQNLEVPEEHLAHIPSQ